jgi:hypothetical protein
MFPLKFKTSIYIKVRNSIGVRFLNIENEGILSKIFKPSKEELLKLKGAVDNIPLVPKQNIVKKNH